MKTQLYISVLFGLPSSLICHENGVFRNRSSTPRNLKTPEMRFSADGENDDITVPILIVTLSNFSGVAWTIEVVESNAFVIGE